MSTAAAAAPAPHSFREVWLISAGHGLTHWYTATFYLLLPLIGNIIWYVKVQEALNEFWLSKGAQQG